MLGDAMGERRKRRMVSAGAPPWMATFADLSTLLLSFFVLLLSFSEMDVDKYKQIAGSLRMAFGVQRAEFARDTPKGTSFVMREFSPGKPNPSPIRTIQQQTDDRPQPFLRVEREGIPIADLEARKGGVASDAVTDASRERLEANLARIRALLHTEIEHGLVEVGHTGSRIVIRIRERGSFPSGSAQLIEPFKPVIRKIGRALRLVDGRVIIAGHTDNVPISNNRFRSNWELSAARAATLVHRLQELARIDPTRLTIEGHADTEPLEPNDTALNRARNRRVEVILVNGAEVGDTRSVDELLESEGQAKEGSASDEKG